MSLLFQLDFHGKISNHELSLCSVISVSPKLSLHTALNTQFTPVFFFVCFFLLLDLCDVIESRAEMFWFRSASLKVLCASQMVLWGVLLAADRLTVEAGESEKP